MLNLLLLVFLPFLFFFFLVVWMIHQDLESFVVCSVCLIFIIKCCIIHLCSVINSTFIVIETF